MALFLRCVLFLDQFRPSACVWFENKGLHLIEYKLYHKLPRQLRTRATFKLELSWVLQLNLDINYNTVLFSGPLIPTDPSHVVTHISPPKLHT